MWSAAFQKVPWVHSGLGKAKSTFGLLHRRADLSQQHGGHHHWDMILKSYSYLLIQLVFCTHLRYACQYSKNTAMDRHKLPDGLKSHYSFLHRTTPAVQLAFLLHPSAVSYWTNDMLWLGHLLVLFSQSPSVLTSKKGKFSSYYQMAPSTLILVSPNFLGPLDLDHRCFIAAFRHCTCENRWTGITWLAWRDRYEASCGRTQS